MTKQIPFITLISLFLSQVAFAEDTEIEPAQCLAAPDLIQQIVLYGIPLITVFVVGLMISKGWGLKATKRSVDPGPHQIAGWAFGLWIGSLTFAGLLYVTSGLTEAGDITNIVTSGSCYPEGWGVVSGIFFLITMILFVVTKMNAK